MKNAARGVFTAPGNLRQSRGPKQRPGALPNLVTLAAVFVFYTMLALTFGIALGFGCILAAGGALAIACATRGETGLKPGPQPAEVRSPARSFDSRLSGE